MTYEIVLHTALPSELSTSESWPNVNSILHPTLSEWGQVPYMSTLREMSWAAEIEMVDDLSNIIQYRSKVSYQLRSVSCATRIAKRENHRSENAWLNLGLIRSLKRRSD